MEEKKTEERTMDEVQKEYSLLCAQAGQLQYQIFIHKKDLEITNDKLRKLNFEAAAINAKKEEKSNG